MVIETWDDIYRYCESNKETDGFCRVCCACSGPCYGRVAEEDKPLPEGVVALRGGNHGGCYFLVKEN